jgi:hypothetical protein
MSTPNKRFIECWLLLSSIFVGTVFITACNSDNVDPPKQIETSLTDEETEAWDAVAVFLTGVFTVANADSFNTTIFKENFNANYDWIKDIFLPHLLGTAEHVWWKCDEYCVKTAKLMANGDKEREKELRELLARHKHHESKQP